MTVIMGVNGFDGVGHDAAAALRVDRQIIAAVEEERLTRIKRAPGHRPLLAIKETLAMAGLTPADIDVVAFPWLPSAMGTNSNDIEEDIRRWFEGETSPSFTVRFVEHHMAHAWCGLAFVPGGIQGRRVGILVFDGSGESTSGACFVFDGAQNAQLRHRWWLPQSASLGIYYEAVTQFIGFQWGDEGKTMGLAAYGREMRLPLPPLLDQRVAGAPPTNYTSKQTPRQEHHAIRARVWEGLHDLYGDHLSFNQQADLALTAQESIGQRVLMYVSELLDEIDVLVLSGGLALNCAINAKVASLCRTRQIELVIPPAASDTGVALGAAMAGAEDPASYEPLTSPSLGRLYTPDYVRQTLHEAGLRTAPITMVELASVIGEQSLVCGWFEGRSEIGPRALGKRSIIARPDSTKVRDRINLLKGRESWRPLAPSLTMAEFDQSFVGSFPSPYMLINATVSSDASRRLKGVVHVDDTSRPQVVTEHGAYGDLLAAMGIQNGSEAVICTSFNRAGEPIVYGPLDALRSAQAMGLDMLAGDGWCARL